MDAQVLPLPTPPRFIPALAEQLALWFPELDGRALAVSEVSVTKDNVPTLPLAMVAFIRSAADPPSHSQTPMFDVVDNFIIDFWLEPARYKRANGTETPFWSYYDYEAIRDTLLANILQWEAPGGEQIVYRGLVIEAEPFAVTLTFTFTAKFRWCIPKQDRTNIGMPFTLGFKLCTPLECCVPDNENEADPCQ
jgi:hypothetical protein